MPDEEELLYANADALSAFAAACFHKLGLPEEDARIAAGVLLESDLRGIESHGLPRFEEFYVNGLKAGRINPRPNIRIVNEAPATALVDGDTGLGMVVGYRSMEIAIRKAQETGAGFVTTRNSRHFGIAGYYSTMALQHQMIGFTITNSSPLMPPTYGAEARLGTNPIALAAPSADGRPFSLDMATKNVAAGKFELPARKRQPVLRGWGGDAQGAPTDDPAIARRGRHFTPLGGSPEMSSHKGYGLSAMIEVLTGVLSGSVPAPLQSPWIDIAHFFGALRIDAFRPVAEFSQMLADMGQALRDTPRVEGAERVYVPGDKEREARERHLQQGIPLYPEVAESLRRVSRDLAVPLEL